MTSESPSVHQASVEGDSVHPLTEQRRLIWDGMRLSRRFFLNHQMFLVRFDAVQARRDECRQRGLPAPSFSACVMHAIGQVLPQHPWLNAYLTPFPRRIVRYRNVDICYTVECRNADGAPYVGFSCLRNAAALSLDEISAQLTATRTACDSGSKAAQHPYTGLPTVLRWLHYTFRCAPFPTKAREIFGTVGFSSVGKWGAMITTPLAPRSLTFSLGTVDRQPVVDGDIVRPGLAAWLTLTYDHRIADGAQVARLGAEIADFLARFPIGPTPALAIPAPAAVSPEAKSPRGVPSGLNSFPATSG
ncbi:branched-chain alpha-keto acid dehydrogenase subunit E2 [Caulifigura coniformis]|uniref:Branched-chain alpha-keto acid dehydrogenase subunit E2 n=1 Tax=Caulifigura coniformis TaxID=2527983 RepID=A0A517S8K3_9PLAN|nr:2-oxo acid dehydrogenase subunit E2 [Caulifigura coniformis]QDT52457.1 branched-chain alpha-keto acid dehydrogenase subunit E2 [Caulifigura coniformis]